MNKYLLKFTYYHSDIDKQLLPWKSFNIDKSNIDKSKKLHKNKNTTILFEPTESSSDNENYSPQKYEEKYSSSDDENYATTKCEETGSTNDIATYFEENMSVNPRTNPRTNPRLNNDYKIGLAIKNSDNNIQFVCPFSIYIPYASINLFNYENYDIKLKLKTYCYFTRLATFEFNDIESINKDFYNKIINSAININEMVCDLYDLESKYIYINILENMNILTKNNKIIFKNLVNNKIYPFIWIETEFDTDFIQYTYPNLTFNEPDDNLESNLESNLEHNSVYDRLIEGCPVYLLSEKCNFNMSQNNDTLIGIVYSYNKNITIIPIITIIKMLSMDSKIKNIFFDFEINKKYNNSDVKTSTDNKILNDDKFTETCNESDDSEYIINTHKKKKTLKNKHNSRPNQRKPTLKTLCPIILTQTYSQNNLKIGDHIYSVDNNIITENGYIYFSELMINIPLNTYLWYSSLQKHIFNIYRGGKKYIFDIATELINDNISMNIYESTKYCIKDNIVICYPNLLMVAWLNFNEIRFCNSIYIQYMLNPYLKSENNYLFVKLINKHKHPQKIQKIFKPYKDRMYNVKKYLEIFTILNVNINKKKSIDKLVICDINENRLSIDWFN